MAALSQLLESYSNPSMQPLILGGHDRGARICHYLSVHGSRRETLPISGTVLLDIVPTLVQFQTFSTPAASLVSTRDLQPLLARYFNKLTDTFRKGFISLAIFSHSSHRRTHDPGIRGRQVGKRLSGSLGWQKSRRTSDVPRARSMGGLCRSIQGPQCHLRYLRRLSRWRRRGRGGPTE